MTKQACTSFILAPPIEPDVHRRIRLRRHGLQGATARLIGELAFGSARDHVPVIVIAGTSTPAGQVRQ